ncbi:MAG: hypothetical protein ABFD69_04020 [Candidatus Sumerlaeia bacterium]
MSERNQNRWKKFLVGLGLLAVAFVLIAIGVESWFMFLKPVAAPDFTNPIEARFKKEPATAMPAQMAAAGSAGQTTATTERVLQNDSQLCYKPFIPVTSDLTPFLREHRDEMNARADKALRAIAEYELAKNRMDYKQNMAALEKIADEFHAAYDGLTFPPDPDSYECCREIWKNILDFDRWYSQERVNIAARNDQWDMAGTYARDLDWDQEIYCWRKVGGAYGHYRVAAGSVERAYAGLLDHAPLAIRRNLPAGLGLH